MNVITNRGQTFDVNWAWAHDGILMIELPDTRTVGEIAEDFDGLVKIERKSEEEGDMVYTGYDVLTKVIKDTGKGNVLLTLERSDGNG